MRFRSKIAGYSTGLSQVYAPSIDPVVGTDGHVTIT